MTITGVPTDLQTQWIEEGNPVVFLTQRWGWNTTLPLKWAGEYLIKWDYSKVTGNNWLTGIVWNVTLRRPDGTGVGDGGRSVSCSAFDNANVVIVKAHNGENIMMGYDMTTGDYLWTTNLGFIDVQYNLGGPSGPMIIWDSAAGSRHAFDVKTGKQIWETKLGEYPWGQIARLGGCAYGNFYVGSLDGHVYAISLADGHVVWQSDYTGDTGETIYNTTPFGYCECAIADGKLYFTTQNVYAAMPRDRFQRLFCIDAYTGKFLWSISGYIAPKAIADGYLVATESSNGMMYCFGKGQTSTSIVIRNDVVADGSNVLIQGNVLDESPAQPGTPAVSDDSMSEYMDYLHMQNATLLNSPPTPKGVKVQLTAVDPNNNFVTIGTTTTDSAGNFGYSWSPPSGITGMYTITASFAGSESYWPSSSETRSLVTAVPAATTGPTAPVTIDYTLTIVAATVVLLIAIAIVGVLLLRKRP